MPWRKIAANTLYQLFGKGVNVILGIFTIALLTRALGPERFGDYVLITTIPALLFLLADFGANAIFLREVSRDDHHLSKFGGLLALRLLFASLLFLVGGLYFWLSPYPEPVKLGGLITLLAVFFQSAYTSLNALYQHNLRYDLSVTAAVLSGLISTSLIVWGFLTGAGFLFFAGVWTLGFFLTFALALLFVRRLREGPLLSWDLPFLRRLFLLSLPLGLTLVFSQINGKADIFLLSLFDAPQAIGIYGLAYKVFENLLFLPLLFVNALYPVMLADQKKSFGALWDRLRQGAGVMLATSFGLLVLTVLLAPLLVLILGGAEFSASSLVLRLLALGLPLFFLTSPLQWFLIVTNHERTLVVIYGLAALVNVVLNALFIPRFSYFASIGATIAAELLILLLLLGVTLKIRRAVSEPRQSSFLNG